jgi:hypothetical protein
VPVQDFHVQGNALIQKSGSTSLTIKNAWAYDTEQPAEVIFDRTELSSTLKSAVGMDKSSRNFFLWVNGADRLNIDTAGKVGIGTKTPSYLLDVNGDLRVSGDMYWTPTKNIICNFTGHLNECSIDLMNQNTYTGNSFQVWSDKTGIGTIMACRGDNGRVGIGTADPSNNLEVVGGMTAYSNITLRYALDGIHFKSGACNNTYWRIRNNYVDGSENEYLGNFEFITNANDGLGDLLIGWIEDDTTTSKLNFTGSHRVVEEGAKIDPTIDYGLIVSASGKYNSLLPKLKKKQIDNITIDEALPTIKICSKRKDKAVFGVVSKGESLTKDKKRRLFHQGNFKSAVRKDENDYRIEINSLGEGAVWVCDTNGNFENGDFITTSSVSGYGERQQEPYVCNYTVGKITCDVDWNDPNLDKEFQVREVNGHKAAFVGCIYMCG